MAGRDFSIKLDIQQLAGLADAVGRLGADEIADVSVNTTNEIVEETYALVRSRMLKGINLEESYVERKMRVDKATRGKPSATITAFGSSAGRIANNTPLGRYDARPITAPAKSKRGQGPTRIPGLTKGFKQTGVAVSVLRGTTNLGFEDRGFLLPLRRGRETGGNGMGVFARTRAGKLKHFYGPSPYQLFAKQAELIQKEVEDAFADELVSEVNALISRQFA